MIVATQAGAAPAPVIVNVAHRGASALAPEHTLVAYDLAIEQGADYIEQDVHMTADGILVVLHDETLDRTARGPRENCSGPVRTKTLAQLKTCDVGSWFNEEYPERARKEYEGLRIPTLDEVFERYGRRANYYIETKTPPLYPGIEQALLEAIEAHGLSAPAREDWKVLIQSFFPESLELVHALDPELPLIQLYPGGGDLVASDLDRVARYAIGIGPSRRDASAELVEAAHERCLAVHPYTVDEPGEMKRLIRVGVDGMFTNRPQVLDRALKARRIGSMYRAASSAAAQRADCEAVG